MFIFIVKDALIDVAVGLGAPLEKLILTTPAFGNSFNLLDSSTNLPGSSISGPPQRVTYQQVLTSDYGKFINFLCRFVTFCPKASGLWKEMKI